VTRDPVQLSTEELSLLTERSFFYARKAIREKLRALFRALREELLPLFGDTGDWLAPEGLDTRGGQLAGGEYYRDLPYVYLDLPKHFSKESTFTFRWMAWWGNYVFFAFLTHGPLSDTHKERLLDGWDAYASRGLFLAQSDDPWDWRVEPGLALPVVPPALDAAREFLPQHPFLKLMRVLPFDDPALLEGRVIEEAVAFFDALSPLFSSSGLEERDGLW